MKNLLPQNLPPAEAPCWPRGLEKISYAFLLITCFLCFCHNGAMAQQTNLSGTVTNAAGEALPGVTVLVKGTTNGTSTGTDGRFSLSLPSGQENGTLVISFIGYLTQEVVINNRTSINVKLADDAKALQEVVVVGYGTQKRESITGAVASVTAKDLGRVHATTVSGLLAGKIPGVAFRQADGRPGAGAQIQIRNMGGNPLFVIDGIQKDQGHFNNLSPNDIESISVLKDASASIYGSRAANGVVIVTTKRGGLNQKSTINVDAYYGFQNWSRFPETINAYEWNLGKAEAEVNRDNRTNITQTELDKFKAGTERGYQNFNWRDFIIQKNAPQTNLNINASGGSDKINYYISATRLDQNSVLGREFLFNRTNLQSNIDAKISEDIKVGLGINGRLETRENPGVPGGDDYFAPRFALFRNLPFERPYANDNPNYIGTIQNTATNWAYLNYKNSGFFKQDWTIVTPQVTIEYQTPIKGLTAKGLYSYYFADEMRDIFEYTYDTYSYFPDTDEYRVTGGSQNPYRERGATKINETVGQAQLNYTNTFGKHTFSGLFLAERIKRRGRNIFTRTVPKTNVLPILQFADMVVYNDADNTDARLGYVGRFNYNFADRYFLELAARQDQSFKFAPDKRKGLFPSVSVGWRITEEDFFKSLTGGNQFLSDLKLRASYGELGDDNVPIGNFDYISGYSYNTGIGIMSGNATVAARDRGPVRDRVSWLTARIIDVGADFSLLNGKVNGSVDYFRRNREGLVAPKNDVFVPRELGYGLPPENLEKDAVVGGEGSLTYNGTFGNLNFVIGGNYTFARSRFITMYNPRFSDVLDEYRNSRQDRWNNIFWGHKVIGQFQSQEEINNYPVNVDGQGNKTLIPGDYIYQDENGDGLINARDERPIGYGTGNTPIHSGGVNLGVGYKGFDFSADFSYGTGFSINRQFEVRWPFQNGGNVPRFMFDDRWHRADPLNPDSEWIAGTTPALRFNDRGHSNYNKNSTKYLNNVRYFRMRTMELGYTLPTALTSRVKIQKLRFFANSYNLFSLDNVRQFGTDPEIADENGIQFPQNVLINFGFNLSL